MIDELDLGFDERADKGRHRRGYVRKRNKRGRGGRSGRGKTVAALLLTLVLLGALGGGAWLGLDRIQGFFTTPDYSGPGVGEAVIQINDGDTITDVGNTLVDAEVVKSAKAYVNAVDENSRGKNIGEGTYKLRKQMKAADAVTLLLDPKTRIVNGVTVAEGEITLAIYKKFSDKTKIPVDDFKQAAQDPVALGVPEFWFKRNDGKKGPAKPSIEGFLYPATYEIPPNPTADGILRMMVAQFLTVTQEMKFVETVENQRGISPYEALITASIAQAESVHAKDMAPVARVIYNRVYAGKIGCRCLGIDSALNYSFRLQGKDPKDSDKLLASEINDLKNPYNTHNVPGLPITPISNPGKVALEGAMNPPESENIYFMTTDKEGTMGYGKNDAEYNQLIATMCRNGVLSGENCK